LGSGGRRDSAHHLRRSQPSPDSVLARNSGPSAGSCGAGSAAGGAASARRGGVPHPRSVAKHRPLPSTQAPGSELATTQGRLRAMKTFLVVNPNSANGQTAKRWLEISAELHKEIGEFGHAFTSAPMEAAALASQALRDGYQCVVAVGGDGTVNEVVNGFFENGKAIDPNAALGLVPRGTGADFRRTFHWDADLTSAIRRLKGNRTAPLDVGVLEYTTHGGKSATRHFVNICSFGASGLVDRKVNE